MNIVNEIMKLQILYLKLLKIEAEMLSLTIKLKELL